MQPTTACVLTWHDCVGDVFLKARTVFRYADEPFASALFMAADNSRIRLCGASRLVEGTCRLSNEYWNGVLYVICLPRGTLVRESHRIIIPFGGRVKPHVAYKS